MPDPLLYAPVGHPLNSCPSTSCPQQSPRIRCCWSRTPSLHGRKAAASCSLLCPHTPPLEGHWDHPHHRKQLLSWQAQAHAWMHKGVMSSTGWPTCHGWKSKWERWNHHPLKWMLWECRCPACPREASSGSSDRARQWRSWLQVALGSFLCNVQPKSRWFIPSNIWLQPTIILPHDGKCLFFPWNEAHCQANKKPLVHTNVSATKNTFPVFCHHYESKTSDFLLEQSNIGAQSTNHTVKLTVFRKQNCESFGQQFPIKEIK